MRRAQPSAAPKLLALRQSAVYTLFIPPAFAVNVAFEASSRGSLHGRQAQFPAARDIAYYFHPATNARRHEEMARDDRARQGVHVYDDQGKEYIEGLAGLWSARRLRRGGLVAPPRCRSETALLPLLRTNRTLPRSTSPSARRSRRRTSKVQFTIRARRRMIRHQDSLVLQQRHRPSAEEEDHLAPARLSRRDNRGREPHRACRSISAISTCRCR